MYLAGSTVSPSDEDSQTFTVSAVSGDSYKLKAADAKERQFWVNKLRQVALTHETYLEVRTRATRTAFNVLMSSPSLQRQCDSVNNVQPEVASSLAAVRDILVQTQKNQRSVSNAIESFTSTDPELLLLKATSHASVISLEQCFAILQSIQHQRP